MADGVQDPKLQSIYEARNSEPIWIEEDGSLTRDAVEVASLLAGAGDQGLPPDLYSLPTHPGVDASAADKAQFDIAFSRATFKYARDMGYGLLNPASVFDDVNLPRRRGDVEDGFVAALRSSHASEYLRTLEPGGDYPRLKVALKAYEKMAGQQWPQIIGAISRKDYPEALTQRLESEGYLKAPADRTAATVALKAFQTANSLEANGQLDRKTLAALNTQPQERVDQIKANMERWRWLPRQIASRFIVVNVPTANLALIDGGVPVIESKVVVGAPDKQTPIFVTDAVAITINPSWHIPKSIVEKEIKPKIEKDQAYLNAKGISQKNGEYVQNPGPANALGLVKFEMPNNYDVYLHDTPSKQAFLSDDRALSHGCVRVEAIRPLAANVLGIGEDELANKIAENQTRRQPIAQPIPVYILYWTVLPKADGTLMFAKDIYGRDARVASAMKQISGTRLSLRK